MSKKDKLLIILLIVSLCALVMKSFVFDEYKPDIEAEIEFKEKIENILDNKEKFFVDTISSRRIVSIKVMSEDDKKVETEEGEEYIATGTYKAKVRRYLFGVLPFSEETILDINLE